MIQSKYFWPSLIALSGLLTGLLSLTNSVVALRPMIALWFLLVCPGMAFVLLFPIKEAVVQWSLAIALSLAMDALVASILVYAHYWSPNVALVILIIASLAGAILQVIPEKGSVPGEKTTRASGLRRDAGSHKGNQSVKNHSIDLEIAMHSDGLVSGKESTSGKARIILVSNEDAFSASLCSFLPTSKYEVVCAHSSEAVLDMVAKDGPDLVLLDMVSPQIKGWEILRRLGEAASVHTILLTKNFSQADILNAFDLGVDDFLAKSSSLPRLEAQVSAAISHAQEIHASEGIVKTGDLEIDFTQKRVTVNTQRVNLIPLEYGLLEVLARNAGRTVPMTRLRAAAWGPGYTGGEDYCRRYIWSLRKKIETDPARPKHIKTRPGYGYRFE